MPYDLSNRDCIEQINLCVQSARRHGYSIFCPEDGLSYLAIFDHDGLEEALKQLNINDGIVFHLNSDKCEKNWAPYLPFVNSIRDLEDLYDFVVGNLTIFRCSGYHSRFRAPFNGRMESQYS